MNLLFIKFAKKKLTKNKKKHGKIYIRNSVSNILDCIHVNGHQ